MTKKVQTALRLPEEAYERADKLVAKINAKSKHVGGLGEVTRTGVLREAVMRGLSQLEKEHAK